MRTASSTAALPKASAPTTHPRIYGCRWRCGRAGPLPRSPRAGSPRSARERAVRRRDWRDRAAAGAPALAGAACAVGCSRRVLRVSADRPQAGAMFHPEPLGMLITAGALLVLARMVRTRTYSWWLASCSASSSGWAARARLVALDARRGRCCARRRRSERPCITTPSSHVALHRRGRRNARRRAVVRPSGDPLLESGLRQARSRTRSCSPGGR